jgi:hypothetical protein
MWVLRGGPQLVKKLATFWGYHERKIEKKNIGSVCLLESSFLLKSEFWKSIF